MALPAPLSYVQYTQVAAELPRAVPFQFINRNDVQVWVGSTQWPVGTAGNTFKWNSDVQIELNTAPAAGSVITIRRLTTRNAQVVQWTDGSHLIADDLNTSDRQWLYLCQENFDQIARILEGLDPLPGPGAPSVLKFWNDLARHNDPNINTANETAQTIDTQDQRTGNAAAPQNGVDEYVMTLGAISRRLDPIIGNGAGYPGAGSTGQTGKLRIDNAVPASPRLYYWTGTAWTEIKGQGIADAPSDNTTYGRNNATWVRVGGGIPDAPNDGNVYGRQSAAWTQVNAPTLVEPTVNGTWSRTRAAGPAFSWTRDAFTVSGTEISPQTDGHDIVLTYNATFADDENFRFRTSHTGAPGETKDFIVQGPPELADDYLFRLPQDLPAANDYLKVNTITAAAGGVPLIATLEWAPVGGGAGGTVTSITPGAGLRNGGTVGDNSTPITASGTFTIDSSVATLAGAQSLSNKTFTSTIKTKWRTVGTGQWDLAQGTAWVCNANSATMYWPTNLPANADNVTGLIYTGTISVTGWDSTKNSAGGAAIAGKSFRFPNGNVPPNIPQNSVIPFMVINTNEIAIGNPTRVA